MKKIICSAFLSIAFTFLCAQDLQPFKQNDKWGYADEANRIVIPPNYEHASLFLKNGLAKVSILDADINWKYGFIDKTGKMIIPLEYESLGEEFYSGLIEAKKKNKYGFLDKTGRAVIPFKYVLYMSFLKVMRQFTWTKNGVL